MHLARCSRRGGRKNAASAFLASLLAFLFSPLSSRAASPGQQFNVAVGVTVTNSVPGPGAGEISAAHEQDTYTFTGLAGQRIFIYDLGSSAAIDVAVYDSNNQQLLRDRLEHYSQPAILLAKDGTYQARVFAANDGTATGNYSFAILNVTNDLFTAAYDQVVTNNVPGAGAGQLSMRGQVDTFRINATAGQRVYFRDLGADPGIDWGLYNESNQQLFRDRLDTYSPPGYTFITNGTYEVRVFAAGDASTTGNYSFAITHPQDQVFDAAVGLTVTNDVPGAGAGNLTLPGQIDTFRFTVRAGEKIFFEDLGADPGIDWGLYDTNRQQLFRDRLDNYSPPQVSFSSAGTFDLAIFGAGDGSATGQYSFRIVEAPDEVHNLVPGVTVTNGVPGSGAGTLETPGAYDVYLIQATAGQKLYFYDLGADPNIDWSLYTESNQQLFRDRLDGFSPGTYTLTAAGEYKLYVLGAGDTHWTGHYSFTVLDAPDQIFTLPLNVVVTNGVPASGAGVLESPGRTDIYRFHATAGEALYFNDLGAAPNIDWALYDSTGQMIFRDRLDGLSPGSLDITKSGDYELWVLGAADRRATGNYSFSVQGAARQEFPISIGTRVTNNVPGSGAGILDTAGAQDIFTFNARSNQTVYFRDYGATAPINLVLQDSDGVVVGTDFLDGNSPKNVLLTKGGAYKLIAKAAGDGKSTGSYSFALLPPAAVITRQPQALWLVSGRSGTLTVAAESDSPISYQWFRNGAPLATETNATLTFPAISTDQVGDYTVVLTNATDSVTSMPAHVALRPLVLAGQAARTSLPLAPGNGVAIDLFNGIGGGAVPTAEALAGRLPDGSTLSPVIDFPHPGSVINVGNSFDTFFADTTTPPDVVRNLSASNFTLRNKLFLRVSRDLDKNPDTPEIDFELGVGSDDGFNLTVGTNVLGSAGDRGFTYTWMPVAFESEGLYPVTLLFSANAIGQSGLELGWNTARKPDNDIIPQSALYVAPNIGDQLITFEELAAGAVITNQFAARGVLFHAISGALQVTSGLPDRFVPVSAPQVFGDPASSPASGGELDLQFVNGATAEPAITDFVSFFLLNAQDPGAIVMAYDAAGGVLSSNLYHAGGASQELVSIAQPRIARVHISLGSGTTHAAIDNLSFTTPRNGADLAVGVLDASPAAVPGGTLSIVWAVTNVGITEVRAPWTEQVFLTEAGVASQTLAAFTTSNNLAPGQVLVHTQDVAIPFTGIAGSLRAGVRVDAFDEVVELDESNNSSLAPESTEIPQSLFLDASDASTREGEAPLTIRLFRNGDLSSPLTVALSNSNPAEASMPTNVVFSAGQSSATFSFEALPDGIVDGPKIVDLSATGPGYNEGSLSITIQDADMPQLALSIPATSVVEGGSIAATVTRPVTDTNPVTIFIKSSLPARTVLPDSIIIPAGERTVTFQIMTIDDGVPTAPRLLTLSAEAAGYLPSPAQTTFLLDADLPPLTLTLSKQIVSEGDGPNAALATIARPGAGTTPLAFRVQVGDTNSLRAPETVVLPAGDARTSFSLGAIDDKDLNATRDVTIDLIPFDAETGEAIANAVSAHLTVTDNDGPSLTVTLAKHLVGKGLSPATTATITRNGDISSVLKVALAFDPPGIAAVSPTDFAAGQASASVVINTLNDATPGTTKAVRLTASAPGLASGADTLIVSDVLLPDLVVNNVSGPSTVETESYIGVTYRVRNQGFATFNTNVLTRLFLSTSPGTGNDLFAGNFSFTGSIPPGEFFEQTLQVRLPTTPGDYWVIATTDLENHVPEVLEDNNTGISPLPIHVRAAYTATVVTDATVVPAGTPITFRGHAVKAGSNVPAPQVPVHLHLLVRDTRRVLLGVTDDNGNFSVTFTPLPNEAGNYSYAAAHPGIAEPPVQGHFTIVGMRARVPEDPVKLVENSPQTLDIPIENLSDQPLSGLQVIVVKQPANITTTPSLPEPRTLIGSGSTTLSVALRAMDASITASNVLLRVTSTEGATAEVNIPITVESRSPRLVTDPPALLAGMKRGQITSYDFAVINSGGADTGPITLLAPELPWLRVVTRSPLPSLAAGQSNRVTLELSAPADLPLGDYTGALALRAGNLNLSVPFNFRALSEAKGDLRITAVDEYTYYAEGAPPVTNAPVTIRDAITGLILTNGVTDGQGQFLMPQLFEGYYDITVTADKHIGYHGTTLVLPGVTNDVQAFLSRETVRYIWTVVPTEIEDRTTISIETEFETFVPIPVITIEPAVIDLAQITADVTQIDLRISNHGLLAANDFKLGFSGHPDWQLEPLVSEFGSLPARSSLVVPLTIRRLKSLQGQGFSSLRQSSVHALAGPCGIVGGGQWDIVCGTKKHYSAPVQVLNAGGDCPPGGGGSWGGSGTAGAPYVVGPTFNIKTDCSTNNCKEFDLPEIDLSGILKPLAKAATTAANAYLAAQPWNFFLGLELEAKPSVKGKFGICCKDNNPDIKITGTASGEVSVTSKKFNIEQSFSEKFSDFDVAGQTGELELSGKLFAGTKAVPSFKISGSYTKDCKKDKPVYEITISGGVQIKSGVEGSVKGKFSVNGKGKDATAGEVKGGLAGGLEFSLSINSEGERKLCYKSDGMYLYGSAQLFGKSVELFKGGKYYLIQPQLDCGNFDVVLIREALREAEAQMAAYLQTQEKLARQSVLERQSEEGGVCARIRLKLDQDLILTRNAFNATLEILNNDPAFPIEDLSIQVGVLDAANNPAGQLFDISTNHLDGVTAVDGTGMIRAASTGTASFLLVPGRDAAPDQPTIYKVGGILSYSQAGRKVIVPLENVPITVLPDPRLLVKYFHQRDVYADDPFTPVVEPSIPYSLAVMIQNVGKGDARNVRISSAQPQIVDNEKGLLIDFKIIGTEVSGQPATPSLTVDFGTIPAGGIGIGRWLFTSTLQGLFDTYSATIEHTAGPQDNRSSLIDDLSIHEMIHLVQAPMPFDDGRPDFLVNDDADPDSLPDTLYLSDGTTNEVAVVRQATVSGTLSSNSLSVQITAAMPADWSYLLIPDPAQGKFKLKRVLRSDSREIPFGTNVWATDRTFIGKGRKPISENLVHLFDYKSTGTYTLFYDLIPPPESVAPTSKVQPLPANSYTQIPVNWSGADNPGGSGIGYYDIYVSVDHGPFELWLQHTDQTGAVYFAQLGKIYQFYSVATDNVGNREADHATADAQTKVTLENHAPSMDPIPDQRQDEGEVLVVSPHATDPDADVLTWSLVGTIPPGLQINPGSGLITWITGAGLGPSTNRITVQVLDSGIPRLGALRNFTIILDERNFPPETQPLPQITLREGQLLSLSNVVQDPDWPAQQLTFQLPQNAPVGAVVDPVSGLLTWRPNEVQGGSNYMLALLVTDTGTPPLTSTQLFNINVLDTRSDFTVTFGSTNVTAGASSFLPIYLQSAAEVTNVVLDLTYPNTRVSELTLQTIAPNLASATLEAVASNRLEIRFTAAPGTVLPASGELARLHFAADVGESAVLSFEAANARALQANGAPLSNGAARGAPLFLVRERPLLALMLVNKQPILSLYAPPLQTYEIQFKTNLNSATSWSSLETVSAAAQFTPLGMLDLPAPVFLQVREIDPTSPRLTLMAGTAAGQWRLFLSGKPGEAYIVQSRALQGETAWNEEYRTTVTNNPVSVPVFQKSDAGRLYRGLLVRP